MKTTRHCVALVTAPDLKIARKLAKGALTKKLVACANLIPKIESHYWWQGKLEQGNEVLILFKTSRGKLAALEKFVIAEHPYDTPEFLVLSLASGNEKYLRWLTDSIG
jgi:periplasmic divalent cation tolerance protein